MQFFCTFYYVILKKMHHSFHKNIKKTQLLLLLIIIRNVSEESCDTEDWSNSWWTFSFAITVIKYISFLGLIIL